MKVIFSRKGFDSSYGKGCSPILPNGKSFSIPIPSLNPDIGIPYSEIRTDYGNLEKVMHSLGLKVPESGKAHYDPDIIPSSFPRRENWHGIFGQCGAASSYLQNMSISIGDIFLFYGSFRPTLLDTKKGIVFSSSKPIHLIFGYLVIGDIVKLGNYVVDEFKIRNSEFVWAFNHPHFMSDKFGKQNIIFLAVDKFQNSPGYGAFYFNKNLVLTSPGCSKSIWELPKYFHYKYGTQISRHSNKERYNLLKDKLLLSSVAIGQEFVITGNKKVNDWAISLITNLDTYQ